MTDRTDSTGAGSSDRGPDGIPIAVFSGRRGPPIVLVHGATADHTTWRTSGPLLAARHTTHAIDRRGRGASGDGPASLHDRARVRGPRRGRGRGRGRGGRAGRRRRALVRRPDRARGRAADGEPSPPRLLRGRAAGCRARLPGGRGHGRRVEELVAAGDRDEALATFMREIVGMPEADLAAFRADPIWPRRAAAIDTTIRELRAEVSRRPRSRPSARSASPSSRSWAAPARGVRPRRAPSTRGWRRAGRHDRRRAARRPPQPPAGVRGRDRGLPRRLRTWQTDGHGRLLGWIIIGFIAGALSGAVVGGRTARGCLPNVVVGVLGAIVGGWLAGSWASARPGLHRGPIVVAVVGSIVVRVILEAISPNDRR